MGTEPKEPRQIQGVYNTRGEIRQCNEGKYDFIMDDETDPTMIIFELAVPKYLDTTALDVDVNPQYVRCVVKDKVTQLKLPAEVRADAAKVQRSRTTGSLRVEMPLAEPGRVRDAKVQQVDLQPLQPEFDAAVQKPPRQFAGGAVSVEGIYKDPREKTAHGKQTAE